MFRKVLVIASVLAGGIMLLGGIASADEKAAPMDDATKAMMETWEKYGTPGEHHKHLDALVGKWTSKSSFWMDSAGPPMQSSGSSETTWILGGRYLQQSYSGNMMGETFTGMGMTGYNNASKKYESVWIDSEGTGMMVTSGTIDAAGKVITQTGEYVDPMSGKPRAVRYVTRLVSPTQIVFEMHESGPDSKEFKTLEITYTKS